MIEIIAYFLGICKLNEYIADFEGGIYFNGQLKYLEKIYTEVFIHTLSIVATSYGIYLDIISIKIKRLI